MISKFLFILSIAVVTAQAQPIIATVQTDTLTDSRDGKTYKTVKIGTQIWMAENLNYDASGRKCYDNNPTNCEKYGRLYDWATAMSLPDSCNKSSCINQITAPHKGLCPSGWHIPSSEEWEALIDYAGGPSIAGKKLKAKSGWNSVLSNWNGEDAYKFAALPGGMGTSAVTFGFESYDGYWWSALDSKDSYAFGQKMSHGSDGTSFDRFPKSHLLSIRCLKD